MCGIAGIFSTYKSINPLWIKQMTDLLKHRGPDDEGFVGVDTSTGKVYQAIGNDSKVGGISIENLNKPVNLLLGHRRLSIIDLSPSGHQPMADETGNIWIVYNGEVYNYIELREELKFLGYSFRTNTDTEVILKSYKEWGFDCVNHFNGMWAFVIYDKRKNILFGSRDRFGVKPLYYYLDNNYFAFSSEIKAILSLPFYKPTINEKAIFEYLVLGLEEIDEEGFYKNILELFPSYSFVLNLIDFSFKKWKYYNLNYTNEWEPFDESRLKTHAQRVRQLIFEAIKGRLRSDVCLGTCLSGGLDSSTIVCVINQILKEHTITQIGERQKVFTASYEDKKVDESRWAKIVVNSTNTEWYQTFPKEDELFQDIQDLVYYQEVPFGSTSIYAQYRVMKLASENGVKVLIDGQGGDEIFTGYLGYHPIFLIELLKKGKILYLFNELKHLNNSPISLLYLFKTMANILGVKFLLPALRKRVAKFIKYPASIVTDDFFNTYSYLIDKLSEEYPTELNRSLYINMTYLKHLLKYEDRNSMRFSIEARTPFADDVELIEYVFSLPSVYKIHNGWSKFILREAMNGILPKEIKERRDKIGFATPEFVWLKRRKKWFILLLNEYRKESGEFLNVDKVIKHIENDKIFNEGFTAWRVINLILWIEKDRQILRIEY